MIERARKVLPGGVNSPVRAFNHVGKNPIYFKEASGATLTDTDGRKYIDLCMGFGPLLFGHSPSFMIQAVAQQLSKGTSFGACHPAEVEYAEKLLAFFPSFQRVRLLNSGTEAVMTAIRLARGYTGREKILKLDGGYHGHSDGLLAHSGSGLASLPASSSLGVPKSIVGETVSVPLNLDSIRQAFHQYPGQIAAFVMEPIPANEGFFPMAEKMHAHIVELVHSNGALVIFDEVITGFRFRAGGIGKGADLVTLGKIIGGGLPLSAVLGKAEILDLLAPGGNVYQAGTFCGNSLSVAAGLTTLEEIQKNSPYPVLEELSKPFYQGLSEILHPSGGRLIQKGSVFWITWDANESFPPTLSAEGKRKFARFFNQFLELGVYLPPSPYEVCFLSTAHRKEDLDNILQKAAVACKSL